jgi:hypothetical protein
MQKTTKSQLNMLQSGAIEGSLWRCVVERAIGSLSQHTNPDFIYSMLR